VPYLAADVGFVLDRLTAVNGSDPLGVLTGRIDLRRAGAFGLSLGGEVVAEACRTDPRLLACLPMDVWMPADVLRDGLHRPTMWITRDAATMRSEGWTDADVDRTLGTITAAFDGLSGDGYLVQVPGMFHQDFSDAPFLSPLTGLLGITGPIGAERAHLVVSSYTAAFFDRHLRGLPAPLLDGPSDAFPDAVLHRRG
jgi:hypothetical protein